MIDFVQIGANIGNQKCDPIWPLVQKGWKGILIEPLGTSFQQLKENYKDIDGCYFEQVAIADEGGERYLYYNKEGTLQASLVKSFKENDLHIKVQVTTLDAICVKYDLIGVPFTLLQIDAEGSDGAIIVSTNFKRVRPEYVRFEKLFIGRLCSPSPKLGQVRQHLKKFGYKKEEEDIFATIKNKNDELWRLK